MVNKGERALISPLHFGERGQKTRCENSSFSCFRNLSFLFLFFLFWSAFSFYLLPFSFAQETEQNAWSLNATNHLEYSSDRKSQKDIFHNWTDLYLGYGAYSAYLRYEAHQPDDWGKTWQKLSFRNFQLSFEPFEITAGNCYVMMGRGLILRSYENRDLRYDNNLDGVKGTLDLDGFGLTLLGGTATGKYERLNDPLHAAEGKISFTDWMTLGGSYLRTHITDLGLVRLLGGNTTFNFPHLDFYAELAQKDNPEGEYIPKDGKGLYLSTNIYASGVGVTLEYKDYDRFDFTNKDVTFNNPPALTREHVYTLLNRQAYLLNLSDEKGVQAEVTTSPVPQLSVLTNYSYTTDHKDRLVFTETYGEVDYDYKDKATLKAGLSRFEKKNELGWPYRLASFFDLTYHLSEKNSVNWVMEHLWTNKYEGRLTYYDQILSLSFSHSPTFSLTFTHERTTEWKTRQDWTDKKNWLMATLDFVVADNHNLSLGVGSRRKGRVCAGGICVDKPALDGGELKLLSRF